MDLPLKEGIGGAIASTCIQKGATVVRIVRDLKKVRLIPELNSLTNEQLQLYQADLGALDQIRNVCRSIVDRFGGIDALIHNAGIFKSNDIAVSKVEDFDNLMSVNVRAPSVKALSINLTFKYLSLSTYLVIRVAK
jgi:NAD(P)-dependent dehydrogenase (short-subunit alcohol dehydrogenase family)